MDCLPLQQREDTSKARRTLPNLPREFTGSGRRWSTSMAERITTEMAQLNEYGKEFQHCHLGRRGTVHSPISRRVIEDKTYQKRPPEFTPEMEVDYQNYKEVARSGSNMQSQYQTILKTYGGFQRMTEDQHREALELYSGPFDEQLEWVERSPMAIACHLSVFPRNHCHYP